MRADTIPAEIHEAEAQLREIVHVRVTGDAIQGSITTVPVSPERARNLGRPLAIPYRDEDDTAVIASPESARLVEILIHPEDWIAILREWDSVTMGREPAWIWGLPVVS